MIYVLFEVICKEACREDYLELAAGIRQALAASQGFIRSERFTSLSQEGKILSLSVWENEEAVDRWRQQLEHRLAQKQGHDSLFESYRITLAGKIRSYTMTDREEAPGDSAWILDSPPALPL